MIKSIFVIVSIKIIVYILANITLSKSSGTYFIISYNN